MYKKYALSSMALLGLTRAQLWIERSKTFTVHSVTPMNRLLTLVDEGNDDVIVRLDCVNDETDVTEIGPYEYYFNDIQRPDIGQRFCPVGALGEVNKRSMDEGAEWKTNCISQLSELPVFDNGDRAEYWIEPAGGMTCAPDHQLNIMLYNRFEPSISMTYNLDTWQYACIEDDYLSLFFEFGKRETLEGKDLCFSNEAYISEWYDPPFVVNNNCYGPAGPGASAEEPGFDYWECHTEGYRVDLHVFDNEDANEYYGKWRKIREPYMWVQVDFHRVKDYFQIFPEDKAKISFYKGQNDNPQSVTISPAEHQQGVCDPERAADEIICENLSVFCTAPDDTVNLRIAAAGEILLFDAANTCAEIVAGAFDYVTMQSALADDPETYAAYEGAQYLYHVAVSDHEEGAYSNAWFSFQYGTYYRSNEEICFAGDFFPYQSPSCHLQNSGLPVATQLHNPHEYAMDQFVMEIVLNSDYLPWIETEPQVFEIGGEVDLTNQLTSAIQGYVDLDLIGEAVPTSITIESLPGCGVLWRETVSGDEEEFAIFWSYDAVSGFVVQAASGETIDFSITQLFYEGNDDCADLEDQFTYTVMGTIPVEGPLTTTGLQVVETLWAYDLIGLEPTQVLDPVMYTLTESPPFGIELGSCQQKPCNENEVPEIVELNYAYNFYDGWKYIKTTPSCYDGDGYIKDELYQWLESTFCAIIPDCDGTPQVEIINMQGMPQHTDSSYKVTFDYFPNSGSQTAVYCMDVCYDVDASPQWGASMDNYDGATTYGPAQVGVEYDIGTGSGQIMYTRDSDQVAYYDSLSESEQLSKDIENQQWYYTYFGWFEASQTYSTADLVQPMYIPQPDDAQTVTFNEYPSKGWIGYCTVENCVGQQPSTIMTGYEYNTDYYYFVYYATQDAFTDSSYTDLLEEVITYQYTYFVWIVPSGPPVPDSSAVSNILVGIGAAGAPLTVTLLWNAQVDLDLYFYCDDGSVISYQQPSNSNCQGTLDHDAGSGGYNGVRGDGSLGQIENISVGLPVQGHSYNGKVNYYGGSGNAEFQVIFSGTDAEGVLHVYGQEAVDDFSVQGSDHAYSFVYE